MNKDIPIITIGPCPKMYRADLDKAKSPLQTIAEVERRLASASGDIVAGTRRIDTGRLGIPVYLGICGKDARKVMPTRKQMGKGSSPEQAHASALMELMERYAFFTFWQNRPHMIRSGWKNAEKLFGADLVSPEEILLSVGDRLAPETAREILDLVEWDFYPATNLVTGRNVWIPLDWFRMLGEFNGSSAGNTTEESLLQGICELVERHVSCVAALEHPTLPTIIPESCQDTVLAGLIGSFRQQGINLVLKDMSLGMPLPTVGALAWDPSTFPDQSEIVFTAGSASSAVKAAIRAITEVAQLGGDFCTSSCYESSGLPKYSSLEECGWLLDGPEISLSSLPSVENADIGKELLETVKRLAPLNVYAVETTNPGLGVPAHYCIAPGMQFLERDHNQSLGLFVGRKLAEKTDPAAGEAALRSLANFCPNAHYLPFFSGMLAMRQGKNGDAAAFFQQAAPLQPDSDARAMALFYAGYAHTLNEDWKAALPFLEQARECDPAMKEYANLLGVALFKLGNYADAEKVFDSVLRLDKGSAMDLANRGLCRKFQGKKEEAIRDLSAALEIEPALDFARRHLVELQDGSLE